MFRSLSNNLFESDNNLFESNKLNENNLIKAKECEEYLFENSEWCCYNLSKSESAQLIMDVLVVGDARLFYRHISLPKPRFVTIQ